MRLLLDTNILIPLQDSYIVLNGNLKNFIRLAGKGGHQLLYHPASLDDLDRDRDVDRRNRTLPRMEQYEKLEGVPDCPWNDESTSPNDACDNAILYALKCNAVHALITEDKGIHAKAREYGLSDRVYNIQTAEDWLRRLHEPAEVSLPNIEDVPLHVISPELTGSFFDGLREDYQGFDGWFAKKAQEGRRAWIYRDEEVSLGALCVYAEQIDEKITDSGDVLRGKALKLCTFKVGESVRGRKIGELFLKAAFRYATENECLNIFVHGNADKQHYLASLLADFGFFSYSGNYDGDTVWVKKHPLLPPKPDVEAKDFVRFYYPHFRQDKDVNKYLVPIVPEYHDILFPDYPSQKSRQLTLFTAPQRHIGNAIKLAYLCNAQTKSIAAGDILIFYRSHDEKVITTVGVVDDFSVSSDPEEISAQVSRRTVYSFEQISEMARKEVKVILFRVIKHFKSPISFGELKENGVLSGPPQSIVKLDESRYRRLINATGV
ncbi:MAG: EVE domain-containing protein [Alcanivoracaceae bacterium]|nr:EVE domain-containing protein [Alcanivoracaceae bacterium]